ncbi:MAG: 4-carboxy-2-hydroxymuconate-6-semialdehyde dehydrogenase [Candidatus Accumulibacter sp. BA-94]|nr:MAG: 4-carboxy-2-hydroxymuconate-6-semialdehyde dehydrogenase [Candidatus Accumulibacter sp. BA-94]
MRNYPIITDRKIRLALVGCGRISGNHFGAMEQHAEHIDVIDVCDVDRGALDKAVQRTGATGHLSMTEMLRTTTADVVVLATPSGLHPEQTIEVAESGRHVMTEKPMATRWHDGLRMMTACAWSRLATMRGCASSSSSRTDATPPCSS